MTQHYETIRGTDLGKQLQKIVELHDEMRNCFFWNPPCHASARRSYEKNRSNALQFDLNGVSCMINQSTTCSCKHIYYTLSVLVDGKKKNVRALRKLL